MKRNIIMAKAGTVFHAGHVEITLKDDNCVWGLDDNIYFTEKGWKDYKERKKKLADDIDNMRNVA